MPITVSADVVASTTSAKNSDQLQSYGKKPNLPNLLANLILITDKTGSADTPHQRSEAGGQSHMQPNDEKCPLESYKNSFIGLFVAIAHDLERR